MKGLIKRPDLAFHGRYRKQLHIVTLVAWYMARKQSGMGLRVIPDELDDLCQLARDMA